MIVSKTKTPLSEKQLKTLAAAAFDTEALDSYRELTDRYYNSAYLLKLKSGLQTVLKVSPLESTPVLSYEHHIMRTEVQLMERTAVLQDVPQPRVLFSDFSRKLIPRDYYFMDFLEGVPWNTIQNKMDKKQNQKIFRELGRITRIINSLKGEDFGYPALEKRFNSWADCFCDMMEMLLSDARNYAIGYPVPADEIAAVVRQKRPELDEITSPCLIHWDLWPGNVFVKKEKEGYGVSGIIDFERGFWGDPLAEHLFIDLNPQSPFVEGYGRPMMKNPSQITRRHLYNLHLGTLIITEDGPRQYRDKGVVQWAEGLFLNSWKALTTQS